jgi:tetratricopeptide (TPR) repeat protein
VHFVVQIKFNWGTTYMSETGSNAPKVEIPRELAERLMEGEITPAEFLGLSRNTLYAIAEVGYQLLTSGKLEDAKQIYKGLVAADPYDSVFHCHLAATHHKLGEFDEALEEYTQALQFNYANVDALAGRGEIYFNKGQLSEAVQDLKAAMELDPEGKLASTVRAHAIIIALKEMIDQHQASN